MGRAPGQGEDSMGAPDYLYGDPRNPPECKKPNLVGWAKCKNCKQIFWLPDLGSNQGPTD